MKFYNALWVTAGLLTIGTCALFVAGFWSSEYTHRRLAETAGITICLAIIALIAGMACKDADV